jgi:copper chaperone
MSHEMATSDLTYSVPGVSCAHCEAAIVEEVNRVPGVTDVKVELDAKRVAVSGRGLDESTVRAAIEAAGYDVVR